MLKTIVKISNVTNLSDARYCAGMGVEMLGFSIDETSDTYVDLKRFQDIRSWVSGVQIVAETDSLEAETLLERLIQYQPDAIQVSHAELLPWLKSETSKPLILRIEADQDADTIEEIMTNHTAYATYFLLESSSDTALDGDWPSFLNTLAARFSILLGFGVTVDNADFLLDDVNIAGIALRGSDEIRPGYKEFGELMDVLEALEEE
ncbi:N-(5'-phosphoribosyl)anthranilate isomerase [Runella sp. CRIBMP]|uniref:N-(5'-phosphoribosyl)anthranilate isomerase n=1 Tax=Runella sp. CRIBMP TaxID=2683261 RepID=UPI0014123E58|nr:N-(5'-phosphoribosyl)anthranilate isomerase [Runella sp. CRIBMP]NBB20350.1 N-(5'-phosphoribosyl)anthranilate isomerase [Runella sp. CRIBMP]